MPLLNLNIALPVPPRVLDFKIGPHLDFDFPVTDLDRTATRLLAETIHSPANMVTGLLAGWLLYTLLEEGEQGVIWRLRQHWRRA